MTSESRTIGGSPFFSAAVIGLALIICTLIVRSALITVKGFGRVISVTGAATKPITADFAIWEGKVQVSSGELTTAYSKINGALSEVRSFLAQNGFAEKDYEIGAIQINRSMDRESQAVTYILSQTAKLGSQDVERIKLLSTQASTLIEKGIEFTSSNPRYICTKLDNFKVEMIKAATENAKLRAEQLAQYTGKKVGAPTTARVGVFQIRPLHSQEVADYGINDVTSIEKEIVCTVQISFLVE